jgi:effector-binding domain-containing protein
MITPPQIVQTQQQPVAVIHLLVARSQIQQVMGPAIAEVLAALRAQGLAPAGPMFSHHARRPSDTFDFAVGVPVVQPVLPAGRVLPGTLPAVRVVRATYAGGYEGLGAAWGELLAWIDAQGLRCRDDLWECYARGPESGADTASWRTELNRPLAD